MFKGFFSSGIIVASATVFETAIDRFHQPRFLAEYLFPNSDETLPGFIIVDIFRNDHSFHHNQTEEEILEFFEEVRGVRLGQVDLDFAPLNLHALNAYFVRLEPSIIIGASPDSLLARQVDSFVMAPTASAEVGVFEINPQDPTEYAFDRQMFYTPMVPTPPWVLNPIQYWTVDTAIRMIDGGTTNRASAVHASTPFLPCIIGDDSDHFHLPLYFVSSFIQLIAARGIWLTTETEENGAQRLRLHGLIEARMLTLPNIQFVVRNEQGEDFSIYELEPREYIRPTLDQVNTWDVMIQHFGEPNFCSIHKYIVNKLAVHFDVANQRIGFGEPLNEI